MPRRKTGLKKGFAVQVDFTQEEDEFISRISWDMMTSKSGYIRSGTLPSGWPEMLKTLRQVQKGKTGIYAKRKGVTRNAKKRA